MFWSLILLPLLAGSTCLTYVGILLMLGYSLYVRTTIPPSCQPFSYTHSSIIQQQSAILYVPTYTHPRLDRSWAWIKMWITFYSLLSQGFQRIFMTNFKNKFGANNTLPVALCQQIGGKVSRCSLKSLARKFYMRCSSPELSLDIGTAPYTGATHKQATPRSSRPSHLLPTLPLTCNTSNPPIAFRSDLSSWCLA